MRFVGIYIPDFVMTEIFMTSLLGPYDELMLVPGAFDVPGKSRTQLRMTRIYVSQKSTMYNGMYLLSASSPCPC